MLQDAGILRPQEMPGAQRVLRAAALTRVAAALQAVGTLPSYVMLYGRRERRA